eukprot:3741130-Prymnesium_polylepis.1
MTAPSFVRPHVRLRMQQCCGGALAEANFLTLSAPPSERAHAARSCARRPPLRCRSAAAPSWIRHEYLCEQTEEFGASPIISLPCLPSSQKSSSQLWQHFTGQVVRATCTAPAPAAAMPRVAHRTEASSSQALLDPLVLRFLGAHLLNALLFFESLQLSEALLLLLHSGAHRLEDTMNLRLEHTVDLLSALARLINYACDDVVGEVMIRKHALENFDQLLPLLVRAVTAFLAALSHVRDGKGISGCEPLCTDLNCA